MEIKVANEFCKYCGAGIGKFRRTGEGTCPKCADTGGREAALTEQQVERIHQIIEQYSTDVIDYAIATDDINAFLERAATQRAPVTTPGRDEGPREAKLRRALRKYGVHQERCEAFLDECTCGLEAALAAAKEPRG